MGTEKKVSDREIVISRKIEASAELAFEAFTDPEHLSHWWGPDGFTTTTTEFNFQPGGFWRFTMHGPDGTDYPNWVRFEEIARPEQLIYFQGGEGEEPHFQTTVTFESQNGFTLVTLRSVFPSREARDYVVKEYDAIEGGKQTLARLAEYLDEVRNG